MYRKENISVNENIQTQLEAFERIAELAVSNGIADSKQAVVDGLLQREKESTTGFMEGFAIPHTKTTAVTEASVIILKTNDGIEWNSLDGSPVRFIISLLIPESEAGTTHLTLLSALSRMLIHSDVREQLMQANNATEILTVLTSVMQSN
ncbi:fructose PTS transporter subunit IIA [Caldibacillus lycopersici]|uniref:Fructose PTS transporter subunit IIA n=1 Tax=Perspicuibacillus lycopersici TaxID=1325689 RepID=A0AAE3IU17_9BACI|nr:fructose PTS transporter subunit IIA [Perspicuibacillus lycopersici]MCU9614407.1 fructose PTS transporter subunit IIA [Perspicuibacillus lycopersici]